MLELPVVVAELLDGVEWVVDDTVALALIPVLPEIVKVGRLTGRVAGPVTGNKGEQRQRTLSGMRVHEMESGSTADGAHVDEDTRVPAVSDEQ